MSGNLPLSDLEPIPQPISVGDVLMISQETASGFTSAKLEITEFLAQIFDQNSQVGDQFNGISAALTDLENRVGILETNPAIKTLMDAVFHVGSKHMTTDAFWNPGQALKPYFGKMTNWVLYPYIPIGVISETTELGGIVPLLKGSGQSGSNLRIWERLPDNAGNYLVRITPNKSAINEGDSVTFTISVVGVEPGTLMTYQFVNIDEADVDPDSQAKLTGTFINSATGVNTLTLQTVPNRRTDNDRTVTLAIPTYQASGTFVLVDSSKALDGVINVLPGTSQTIELGPNQQADVWVTGAGGSGGISQGSEAQVSGDGNFISKAIEAGKTDVITIPAKGQVDLWMWGGGGDSSAVYAASYTPTSKGMGNGEPSKVTIGGQVFSAGGGLGYQESTLVTSGKYKHNPTHLPGGTNSAISGTYGDFEVTVLENTPGASGSSARTHLNSIWGMIMPSLAYGATAPRDLMKKMHGAGFTGIDKNGTGKSNIAGKITEVPDGLAVGGGGAGGFLKLRVKNTSNSPATISATAGGRGYRFEAINPFPIGWPNQYGVLQDSILYSGRGGQDGIIQVVEHTTKKVTIINQNQSNNSLKIPAGKSAEVWLVGGAGAAVNTINGESSGAPSILRLGTNGFLAGGGAPSAYLPGSPSGGTTGPLPGATLESTTGLPVGVTVEILKKVIGPSTVPVLNEYDVWSMYTSDRHYVYGYGPFGGVGHSFAYGIMLSMNKASAAGALLGLKVSNNGTTDLTLPIEVGATALSWASESENPGVYVDEYEVTHLRNGGEPVAIVIMDEGGSVSATEFETAATPYASGTVKVPANGSVDVILIGAGGGGGAYMSSPRKETMWGGRGGDSTIKVGDVTYKAGGGGGGKNFLGLDSSDSSIGRYPGAGGMNIMPFEELPNGVRVEITDNVPGVTPSVDAFVSAYKTLHYYGGKGWIIDPLGAFGTGGDANPPAGIVWSTAGGGSGGKLQLRIFNDNPNVLELPVTAGSGGIAGKSGNSTGSPGTDGIVAVKSIAITVTAQGYNGQWSYVAFQSPLISGTSSPYIEDIYWALDEKGDHPTVNVAYGDHAYLIIKTLDVEDSVTINLAATGLTQEEMGGGELGKEIALPITKIAGTNKGIASYLIQTLDDDEMSFRNSKYVSFTIPAERTHSTIYTNDTNYTIVVSIWASDGARELQVSEDGVNWVSAGTLGHSDDGESASAVVPPKHKYRVNGTATIRTWSELRYKGIK